MLILAYIVPKNVSTNNSLLLILCSSLYVDNSFWLVWIFSFKLILDLIKYMLAMINIVDRENYIYLYMLHKFSWKNFWNLCARCKNSTTI